MLATLSLWSYIEVVINRVCSLEFVPRPSFGRFNVETTDQLLCSAMLIAMPGSTGLTSVDPDRPHGREANKRVAWNSCRMHDAIRFACKVRVRRQGKAASFTDVAVSSESAYLAAILKNRVQRLSNKGR